MKQRTSVIAAALSLCVASTCLAECDPNIADLRYDPATGTLTAEVAEAAGGIFTNIVLRSNGAFLNTETLTDPFGLGLALFNADTIQATGTANLALDHDWVLPGVLPPDLSPSGFRALITEAKYVGQPGTGNPDFDPCPEPGAIALAGLGLVGVVALRRRRG